MARWAITGGTGMIGTRLAATLRARGDQVSVLTRRMPSATEEILWDPLHGVSTPRRLEGLDGVFNLAGAPIGSRPWTTRRRQLLWQSRVDATETLLRQLASLDAPPKAFVGVGHMGILGDRGDEILDESATPGSGFLADLSRAWEEAELEAERVVGSRTAVLRMNIVLSPNGGAFPLIVKPFRHGIGGWLGTGQQWTPWISVRDAVGALVHLAEHHECRGAFHGSTPEPQTNYEWCRALGRALGRPVRTHAPKWALRGALGELADGVFLASIRAIPRKLLAAGYAFEDADLEATFGWLVERLAHGRPGPAHHGAD